MRLLGYKPISGRSSFPRALSLTYSLRAPDTQTESISTSDRAGQRSSATPRRAFAHSAARSSSPRCDGPERRLPIRFGPHENDNRTWLPRYDEPTIRGLRRSGSVKARPRPSPRAGAATYRSDTRTGRSAAGARAPKTRSSSSRISSISRSDAVVSGNRTLLSPSALNPPPADEDKTGAGPTT